MILIGLGSNISGPWGSPRQTVEHALLQLNRFPLKLVKQSTLLATKPFGLEHQPDFINAVAIIETVLPPHTLIRKLHMIEREAGRRRGRRWGPRTLDLDLLTYHNIIKVKRGHIQKQLILPHPGIAERLFVLEPIAEITTQWCHPQSHLSAKAMIQKL